MAYPRFIRASLCGLALLALPACTYSLPKETYVVGAAYNQPYYLDAGDQLRITVYGQEDLTRVYPVNNNGSVSMPLIGSVQAKGRTIDQLEGTIASALAAGYLRDPDVSIDVQTYRPFFILGEVRTPGQYPYVAGMTAETAVAIAGGFTYRAYEPAVEIRRSLPDKVIRGTAPIDMPIMPGDTVTVHERHF